MQIGDPKKALILGIVAIIILCVAAFQLMPKGMKATTQAAAANVANAIRPADKEKETANKAADVLPATISSDPFSRQVVAKQDPKDPKAAAADGKSSEPGEPNRKAEKKNDIYKGPFAPPKSDTADEDPFAVTPIPFIPHNLVDAKGQPVEIASTDQKVNQDAKKTSIELIAIVKVDHRTALISINGEEAKPFRVGSTLIDDIRLIELTDSKMTLQIGTATDTLAVGGKNLYD